MKRAAVLAIVLLVLAIGMTGLLRREETSDVRLTGVVSANEAFVASELSGRLRELRVAEGDRVEKGQVVAVLATEEIDSEREQKLAAIDQLSARLAQGEEKVRLESARVKSQIESATAQLRAVESLREEMRAELEQALKDLARATELLAQGLVARQLKEQQETEVEVVRARVQTANDRVEMARAELDVYRASERQVLVMEQEVEQTEAQVAQARAELAQIAVRRGYTELRSPLTGVVSVRVAREGEFVAAGSPVVTVVDLADIWVRAEVEETLLGRVVLGQPLKVILASDQELEGEVTFISPEAGFATQRDVDRVKRDIRTFGIKVALDNPDGRIHPGMTAFVVVPGGDALPAKRDDENGAPVMPAAPEPSPATQRSPVLTGTAIAAPSAPPVAPRPTPVKEKPNPKPREVSRDTEPQVSSPKPAPPVPPENPVQESPEGDFASPPSDPPEEVEDAVAPRGEGEMPQEDDVASLEEVLGNIDLEDPSEADLALLEAALNAETVGSEKEADGAPESRAERKTAPKPAPLARAEAASSEPPPLHLEGISVSGGRPVAIINGARVFEGDSVSGLRVVRILEDSVVLDFGGRTLTLRF